MPFDPTNAKPEGVFDPTMAKPETGFDPTNAKPVEGSSVFDKIKQFTETARNIQEAELKTGKGVLQGLGAGAVQGVAVPAGSVLQTIPFESARLAAEKTTGVHLPGTSLGNTFFSQYAKMNGLAAQLDSHMNPWGQAALQQIGDIFSHIVQFVGDGFYGLAQEKQAAYLKAHPEAAGKTGLDRPAGMGLPPEVAGAGGQAAAAVLPFAFGLRKAPTEPKPLTGHFPTDFPATYSKVEASNIGNSAFDDMLKANPNKSVLSMAHDALDANIGAPKGSDLAKLPIGDKIKLSIQKAAMQSGEQVPPDVLSNYADVVVKGLEDLQRQHEVATKPAVPVDDPIIVDPQGKAGTPDQWNEYRQQTLNSTPENNAVQLGIGPMGVLKEKLQTYKAAVDVAKRSANPQDTAAAQAALDDLSHTWDHIFIVRTGTDKAAHGVMQDYIHRNGNMSFDEAMVATGLVAPTHDALGRPVVGPKIQKGPTPPLEDIAGWMGTTVDKTGKSSRSLTRTMYGPRGKRGGIREGIGERRHRQAGMLMADPNGLIKNAKDLAELGAGVTKYAAAGLVRPSDLAPDATGNVTMWRATRPGQDTKLIPGAWLTDQQWIANDIYRSRHVEKYGKLGEITQHTIPNKYLVKVHPNGYVYAPPGTDMGPVIRYVDESGKNVTFRDLVDNLSATQDIMGLKSKKQGGWIDAQGNFRRDNRDGWRVWSPIEGEHLFFPNIQEATAYTDKVLGHYERIEKWPTNKEFDRMTPMGYFQRGMLGTEGSDKLAKALKDAGKGAPSFQTPSAAAQHVKEVMEQNRQVLEASRRKNASTLVQRAVRGVVSSDYYLRKALEETPEGREALYKNVVKNGAGMAAKTHMDAINANIFNKLPHTDKQLVDEITRLRRIIQIDNYKGVGTVRHEGNITGPMATARIFQIRDELGRGKYAQLKQVSDYIFEEEKKLLDLRLEHGIIDQAMYDKLKNLDYTRTQYLDIVDPAVPIHSRVRNMPTSIRGSGIGELGHGKLIAANMDTQGLLMEDVYRAYNTVFRNEAIAAMKRLAEQVPDNGIVRIPSKEVMSVNSKGEATIKHTPEGWTAIGLRTNGKQDFILMKDEFADQFVTKPESGVTEQIASILRIASGSALVKYTSTGANPTFIFAGIPMDIWHTWAASQGTYSPWIPMALGQMGKDLMATAGDAFGKKGAYRDAMMEGMGSAYLAHESRGLARPRSVRTVMQPRFEKIKSALSYLNDTSDMWIRLAYRKRLIDQGVPTWEATAMSRDRLDYYQGGQISKFFDTIIPYTNVTIQATWKGFEKMIQPVWKGGKPMEIIGEKGQIIKGKYTPRQEAMIKMAQVVGVASAIKLASMAVSPETDKAINPMDKVRNFNITFGDQLYVMDPNGNKRYAYIPVRLDQVIMPYNAAVVGGLEYAEYGKVPTGLSGAAVGQVSPVSSYVPVPSIEAISSYVHNYDDFVGSQIYKGPRVKPEDEIRTFGEGKPTSPLAVAAGQALGMSPMRLQTAAGKVVNMNNFYIKAMGGALREIMGSDNPRDNATSTLQILANSPGFSSIIKLTSPSEQQIQDLMDTAQAEGSIKAMSMHGLNDLLFQYQHGQNNISQKTLETYINNQPPEIRQSLVDHLKYTLKVDAVMRKFKASEGIPSKAWWIAASKLDGTSRGQAFYNVWVSASPEERQRMEQMASALQNEGVGFANDAFKKSFTAERKMLGDQHR